MLRIFKLTDESRINRAAGDLSIVLTKMRIEAMQEYLPTLKAEWIRTGDTDMFMSSLKSKAEQVWIVNYSLIRNSIVLG